jgi:hypothetical protein
MRRARTTSITFYLTVLMLDPKLSNGFRVTSHNLAVSFKVAKTSILLAALPESNQSTSVLRSVGMSFLLVKFRIPSMARSGVGSSNPGTRARPIHQTRLVRSVLPALGLATTCSAGRSNSTGVRAGNRNLSLLFAMDSLPLTPVRWTVEVVHENPAVPVVQDKIRATLMGEAQSVFFGLVSGWMHRRGLLIAFAHHCPPVFSRDDMYRWVLSRLLISHCSTSPYW